MMRNEHVSSGDNLELVNAQNRYRVRKPAILAFAQNLHGFLRLGKKKFNVCLVDDLAIRRLNQTFRGLDKPTDVLSFPWNEAWGGTTIAQRTRRWPRRCREFANFLGEVVISVETARRNAAEEGHSLLNEIRWLVLHGVLHLLGYDHERDSGEMTSLELDLREQLETSNRRPRRRR